ncbi:hypothetical protein ACFXA3_01215 [Streptomyces sp. NPDC059456]|uniref:hypothetical protein n=1 Tax=Streptomyces sp. NPDC059456 TaxID=3346838 RepID=UPI0036B13A69
MTTPLRERGLTFDVDYGLDDWIVYAWPPDHDAVFIIGSDDGWLVTYEAPAEDRSSITVLYDSRPQPDPEASTHIAHLITAVESHLTHLPRRSPPAAACTELWSPSLTGTGLCSPILMACSSTFSPGHRTWARSSSLPCSPPVSSSAAPSSLHARSAWQEIPYGQRSMSGVVFCVRTAPPRWWWPAPPGSGSTTRS